MQKNQNSEDQSKDQEEKRTLWVGDIQTWMDETYLSSLFSKTGQIESVKIIRDKQTQLPQGYGFVNFANHEAAATALQTLQGSINPATGKPFRLNWGVYGGSSSKPSSSHHSTSYHNSSHGNSKYSHSVYGREGPAKSISRTAENLTSVSLDL
jgi:RNA recognition motif-containing protein